MNCMYCGKEVKPSCAHNPDDFGLHSKYVDFSDKCTCTSCNTLVTVTNRLLQKVLETNGSCNSLDKLENHIIAIKELYGE